MGLGREIILLVGVIASMVKLLATVRGTYDVSGDVSQATEPITYDFLLNTGVDRIRDR